LAAASARWTWSVLALSLAVCAKFWPAILFPLFAGWRGWLPQRRWQWLVLVPAAGIAAAPYWSNIGENARFLSGFFGGWRNNDSFFGLLLWLTGDVYLAKYTAFALLAAVVVVLMRLEWPLEKKVLAAIVAMLLISSNCHPWYLTWFLPLLALHPSAALLAWCALAPLAYEVVSGWVLLGEWHGSTPARWWVYVPVFALLAWRWRVESHSLPR